MAAEKQFENEFMVDDLIQLILAEAGYEDKSMPFDEVKFQRMLYNNRDQLPGIKPGITFRTSGTYPHSDLVERAFARLAMAGVFRRVDEMKLAGGTREYCETTFSLSTEDLAKIKELAADFKKRMRLG